MPQPMDKHSRLMRNLYGCSSTKQRVRPNCFQSNQQRSQVARWLLMLGTGPACMSVCTGNEHVLEVLLAEAAPLLDIS